MDTQHENIGWNKLRVAKQPGMMIVFLMQGMVIC